MLSLPARPRRLLLVFAWAALLLATFIVAPVGAKEKRGQLPTVNNFATARFKLLTTSEVAGAQDVAFGGGAVVLPNRTQVWIGSNDSPELTHIIQIGTTLYMRKGNEEWKKSDSSPIGNTETQPVSAQFTLLQEKATSILELGAAQVGDVSTMHYQVWVSGKTILELAGANLDDLPKDFREFFEKAAFKYDFWVGAQDGFLHQQMTTVMLPSSKSGTPSINTSTLVTFIDINDPNISVNAPI